MTNNQNPRGAQHLNLSVRVKISPDAWRPITLAGRDAWALLELLRAGNKGCTPIDNPAPRWSAYVHNLRHRYGVWIETVNEPHGGAFPGTHARYVLQSEVEILSDREAA